MPRFIPSLGIRLTLVLNGTQTVDVEDSKLASAPSRCSGGAASSSSARSR
jgi:hypothetical protein